MRPRPVHRWLLLGPHRTNGQEWEHPLGAPALLRCSCRWVLGLDLPAFVGPDVDLSGLPDGGILWAPRWVLEDAWRAVW